MSQNLAYNYAELDPETNMCIGIQTVSVEYDPCPSHFVPIHDDVEDYLFKYYINGNWYEDAEGTIPWTPPTA